MSDKLPPHRRVVIRIFVSTVVEVAPTSDRREMQSCVRSYAEEMNRKKIMSPTPHVRSLQGLCSAPSGRSKLASQAMVAAGEAAIYRSEAKRAAVKHGG